jgi:outer membrane lipoprotein SlyB
MKNSKTASILVVSATLALAACTTPPSSQSPTATYPSYPSAQDQRYSQYGYVESIEVVAGDPRSNSGIAGSGIGIGAIGGAIAGGVLGNQVGSGSGRAAATVGGAVAGGVVGHQVEQRMKGNNNNNDAATMYRFRVRIDDGSYQTFTQDRHEDIRVGNRVRINNGRVWPS